MKWLWLVAGVFVVLILVILVLGLLQPMKHSVTCSIHLKQKMETVFAVLDDSTNLPDWSSTVRKVELLPARDGRPTARYTLNWGNMQMIVTQLERTPPTRLINRMTREGGPTLGTWTCQITPEGDGCRVSLTEDGEIGNPFFRVIGRMRGLDTNIRQTLADLARKFGESVEIQTDHKS